MNSLPAILDGLPIHWTGTDDTTPAGCTLAVTEVAGIATTYIIRDGQVLGRIEAAGSNQIGYRGSALKGGAFVGSGMFYELATRIATDR